MARWETFVGAKKNERAKLRGLEKKKTAFTCGYLRGRNSSAIKREVRPCAAMGGGGKPVCAQATKLRFLRSKKYRAAGETEKERLGKVHLRTLGSTY